MVSYFSQLAKQVKAGINLTLLHLELRCYCCSNHRYFEMDNLQFIKFIVVRIIAIDMVIIVAFARTVNLVDIAAAKEPVGIAIIKHKGYIIIVIASHIPVEVHISFHCTVTKQAAIVLLRI